MVGDMLYGYCGGLFGRDSYEDKRIEARGADWIVCRTTDRRGNPVFVSGSNLDAELAEFRTPEADPWKE